MGARRHPQGRGCAGDGLGGPGRVARPQDHPPQPPLQRVQRRDGDHRHDAVPHRTRRPGEGAPSAGAAGHGGREGAMSHQWGRVSGAGAWQRPKPVWFMSLVLVAVASGIAVWYYRQAVVWTPLQQFYLSAYARSALANSLGIQTGRYRVLAIVNRHG